MKFLILAVNVMFMIVIVRTAELRLVPKKLFSTRMKPFVMTVVQRGMAND
jgi:hypothetical protein